MRAHSALHHIDFANMLTELCELPRHKYTKHPTKGLLILKTIITTMKAALQRGESVSIDGFGTFTIVTRPARPNRHTIVYGKDHIQTTELIYAPARKYAKFTPSLTLKAIINEPTGTMNAHERRCAKTWETK